ncbi:hypothetical protein [Opitutus sp. GAS368]|jgi:hypothetical protein|uniref:hypothetical protein n=1 Tax=Opitutus sp. GAS368 TaxID=1882749 RepID=UPI00087CCDE1|nr:hypothetical protein [Opitutus sp. GAS368]SDR72014.1 hypothetical protein SAMN05444173_0587 [Opitutus sp. GAS368]
MKLSAVALALIATVSVAATEPAAAPAPATPPSPALSAEIAQQLTATLPGYVPPAPAKPVEPIVPTATNIREQSIARAPDNQKAGTPDPEVLELPKITVKQQPKPRVRLGEGTILGPKAFNDELAKKNLSAFDRNFLNKFTLPLFGTSAADRAREDYNIAQKQQFLSDVSTIAKAAEQTDPAAAKALREAAAKP